MSKRMFEPGDYITSLSELSEQEFVFHRKKILNRGWFMSWQLQYAETQIKLRYVRKAKTFPGIAKAMEEQRSFDL